MKSVQEELLQLITKDKENIPKLQKYLDEGYFEEPVKSIIEEVILNYTKLVTGLTMWITKGENNE